MTSGGQAGQPKSDAPLILIVDDEQITREMCVEALRKYRVISAASCEEAVRIYERERIDLVLSDIVMPGDSGIELLKRIKSLDPNATVIMMTGLSDKEVILSALKEDADDFINKPLNLLQLRLAIEKALAKKSLKEELAHIKHSDELKNAFLSLVSHKLRTPVTGISLFLQNLHSGAFSPDDPLFQQSVDMAHSEVRHLGRLISDLLAFSQAVITDTNLNSRPSDLNGIIADVLITCRDEHAEFDVDFEAAPDTLPPVMLDPVKISFALYQIIDNALKFSDKDKYITIRLENNDDSVAIVISDRGIGIPEPELVKVFEKFYQVDPDQTGQVRGFGLGLFYARDFVRQHGGNITLSSLPGQGTSVTITLPLQPVSGVND